MNTAARDSSNESERIPPTRMLGLFTAVSNESDRIDQLFHTVIRQTIRPIHWLIVDDGSTDGSQDKLAMWCEKVPWAELIRRPHKHERSDLAMADVFDFGLRTLGSRLVKTPSDDCYLAKLDADLLLAPDCLERLVLAMSEDNRIGIIGPSLGKAIVQAEDIRYFRADPLYLLDEPTDGIRLYRFSCLSGIGWLPQQASPDAAALHAAREAGWETERLRETLAWTTRLPGLNLSWEDRGVRWASNRCSLPLVLANLARQVLSERTLRGLPAIISYARASSNMKGANVHGI